MMQNYIKRGALLLGAIAMVGSAAFAEGEWQSLNNTKLQNAAFYPGWSGALTAAEFGVGECYNGAFNLYQEFYNLPAGEYTLTCNAFYRSANPVAYVYINDQQVNVAPLGEGEGTPNSMETANVAFEGGKYLNTVKANVNNGHVIIGIKSLGDRADEWCCFDNFKLVGPNGEVPVVNGTFDQRLRGNSDGLKGINDNPEVNACWDFANVADSKKYPDCNAGGGIYRKTNASPYAFGQLVELEAGKYRFSVQSFLRYGGGSNTTGGYYSCKGAPKTWVEGASAKDNYGKENPEDNAYIFVSDANIPAEDGTEYAFKPFGVSDIAEGEFFLEKPVMNLFDIQMETYPENVMTEEWGVETDPFGYTWGDSGNEYQAAKYFVNNPEAYRNYIEFELTATTKVWVGMRKDKNAPKEWWQPWCDVRLEKWVENADGIEAVDVENAPVEYYNLQGVKVLTPAQGQIYIVKQGNKVAKQVIR